jgi:hypothetical protein
MKALSLIAMLVLSGCTNIRPYTEPLNEISHAIDDLRTINRKLEVTARQLGIHPDQQKKVAEPTNQ